MTAVFQKKLESAFNNPACKRTRCRASHRGLACKQLPEKINLAEKPAF
jgi:hypothetical protein